MLNIAHPENEFQNLKAYTSCVIFRYSGIYTIYYIKVSLSRVATDAFLYNSSSKIDKKKKQQLKSL